MRSLDEARNVCERYHPGMCAALADISLAEREAPGGPVLDIFRRAMASYSPALGAATTRLLRLGSPVAAGSPVPRQVVTTATESCSPWLCGVNRHQVLL